jgi:hypothetical protein
VFVVAYQKMLPLLYLDKLLDELQLRSYLCTGLLIQKLDPDPDPHWQCSGSVIASRSETGSVIRRYGSRIRILPSSCKTVRKTCSSTVL